MVVNDQAEEGVCRILRSSLVSTKQQQLNLKRNFNFEVKRISTTKS